MISWVNRLLRLHEGEAGLVAVLGVLLFTNMLTTQISGVIAISGFLSEGGINQFLIVLLIDMAVILVVTSVQSLIVDRYNRTTLIRWMCLVFALLFLLLRGMFALQMPGWLNYSLLYLLAEQQWLFFPLIFWALASDIFDTAQTRRLFPLINSLGFAGKVTGLLIATLSAVVFSTYDIATEELLTFNALLYVIAFIIASIRLRQTHTRQTVTHNHESLMTTLAEGWKFVKEVPAFRYMLLAILALSSSDIIIEFRFLVVTDTSFPNASEFQAFYGLYRLATGFIAFIFAGLFASRIIEKLTLKNTFFLLPLVMFISAVWLIMQDDLFSAVFAFALMGTIRDTIDETSRKSFQALVPDERRGRVSVLMDSYLLAVGTIVGCTVTGLVVMIGQASGSETFFRQYLGYVAIASLFAIWAIYNMRKVYDSSMYNWRLKRRQRAASVLDKLEF